MGACGLTFAVWECDQEWASPEASDAYLCVCENGWRNDFIGAEGLPGVDEGRQDLSTLFALRCGEASR